MIPPCEIIYRQDVPHSNNEFIMDQMFITLLPVEACCGLCSQTPMKKTKALIGDAGAVFVNAVSTILTF